MTARKPPAQLDREIQTALSDKTTWSRADSVPTGTVSDFSVRVGSLGYRVTTGRDFDRGGYRARLIAEGIGMTMDENGSSPSDALTRLARSLHDSGDATDKKLAQEIARHAWFPLHPERTPEIDGFEFLVERRGGKRSWVQLQGSGGRVGAGSLHAVRHHAADSEPVRTLCAKLLRQVRAELQRDGVVRIHRDHEDPERRIQSVAATQVLECRPVVAR